MKKLFIKTYGCQMNVYDSDRIEGLLSSCGYVSTQDKDEADVIVLNTCHIREKAAEKLYSELGRVNKIKQARQNQQKDMTIVVAGCVGQAEGSEIFSRAPYVDVVVGPQSYHNLPSLLEKIKLEGRHLIDLDFGFEEKFDKLPENSKAQGVVSYLSIQEGCDKFCHFCVVPYTRGAEFSRPVEQVYNEALMLAANGAKEIVLLGQNVNAYHGSFNGSTYSLADLISKIAQISSLQRIRYTTSHPRDMSQDLIALHGKEEKLMPFLHLPIQSGSDKILSAMNRKHTAQYYLEVIDQLRAARPDIALHTDIIVGFPTETEEDFEQTMKLVEQVGYMNCFSFMYSPRPGTPAATAEQIPSEVKYERLQRLQQLIRSMYHNFNKACVGHVMPVLFDKIGKHPNQVVGNSPYMHSVYIDNAQDLLNKLVDVKIEKGYANSVRGVVV
ncbi:tRNA (N6-isopentenyl adenosine(37)-C2)-methylthiotransferase MiaB [Candidatus Sarmatiella mevalonica]|uniref:tRNA (N6-isopentenyl adenosine(37)-C2)-methylthiotransferase MiaB n=1 Tax=Candidatus Sarmatiella mevalonica TaxID=2770581 RepID=UPI001921A0BE|nr:tRNA (N6-isopentenyl adenosine(37)-C2)-methylthiotransferase MiaB [Candidatus Sarmatiella mevalonica]